MNINTNFGYATYCVGNSLQKPYISYREMLFANSIENNEMSMKMIGAIALIALESILLCVLLIPSFLYAPLLLLYPLIPVIIAIATIPVAEISLGFLALLGKFIVYLNSFQFNIDDYKENQQYERDNAINEFRARNQP